MNVSPLTRVSSRKKILGLGTTQAILLIIGLIVLLHWQILFTTQFTILDSPDGANQMVPWYQFAATEFKSGSFPLWERHLWLGQPLVGQVQPSVLHPLNWIYFFLPLRADGHIKFGYLQGYYVVLHVLAALFCFAFLRDLGLKEGAAAVGGLIFSLGGYLGTTFWINLLHSAIYIPLVALFAARAWRRYRELESTILFAFFLGLSWLAGHHNIPILMSLTGGIGWLIVLYQRRGERFRTAGLAALWLIGTVLIAAIQILPTLEYGKRAIRWLGDIGSIRWDNVVPYASHAMLSFRPRSLTGIFLPIEHYEFVPYVGILAVLLVVGCIWSLWNRTEVRWLVVLGGCSLVYAMGGYSIVHGVFYSLVPLIEKARWPGTAMALFHLSVSALAAFGLHSLLTELHARKIFQTVALWGAAICAGWFVFQAAASTINPNILRDDITLAVFFGLIGSLALHAHCKDQIDPSVIILLAAVIVSADIMSVTRRYFSDKTAKDSQRFIGQLSKYEDVAAFLRSRELGSRTEVPDSFIPYNFGDWHGVDTLGGFLPSLTANAVDPDWNSRASKRTFAAKYYVGRETPTADFVEVFNSQSGLKVFEDRFSLPRVWISHQVRTGTMPDMASWLAKNPPDLKAIWFERAPTTPEASCADDLKASESAKLLSLRSNEIEAQVDMKCNGWVVLSDTYFPGWSAFLDGKEVPIREVNFRLRGVFVPPGKHELKMTHRPMSVLGGAAISIASAIAGIGFVFWRRKVEA